MLTKMDSLMDKSDTVLFTYFHPPPPPPEHHHQHQIYIYLLYIFMVNYVKDLSICRLWTWNMSFRH